VLLISHPNNNIMPEEGAPCRDFERGVCTRGDKCRYAHPERAAPAEGQKQPICKDFQNKGCDRRRCKFLHLTNEEESVYNSSGELPPHQGNAELVAQQRPPSHRGERGERGGGGSASRDVCKDFMNGKCDRGNRCKFSHVSEHDERNERIYGKRARVDYYGGNAGPPPPFMGAGGPDREAMYEENEMLRRKITDLQREVLSLREMNDTLYDQNKRYLQQIGGNAGASSSSTSAAIASPTAGQRAGAMDPVMYPSSAAYTSSAPPAAASPYGYVAF